MIQLHITTYKSLSRKHFQQSQELHPILDVLKQVIDLQRWFMLRVRKHKVKNVDS